MKLRSAAAIALGRLGDPRAIEPLNEALGDVDSDVRRSAEKAISMCGQEQMLQGLS